MSFILSRTNNWKLLYNSFPKRTWDNISQSSIESCKFFSTAKLLSSEDKQPRRIDLPLNYSRRQLTKMTDADKVFQGIKDRYKGITISSMVESCDAEQFSIKLKESLETWENSDLRGVWFKVATEHAEWVPILAKNNFIFHHAQSSYVMMYRWLPKDEESNVPRFAHTMIGVGAIVVNDAEEILVVREKYFPKGFPHWKLPGGYVESGEDIEVAAIREVLEETSIETKFQFLVSFRHTHGANFNCSDIYFVVGLSPITTEIKKCDREIMEAKWMKMDEYLSHELVHETNRAFVEKYLEYKSTGKIISLKKRTHPLLKKPFSLFEIEDSTEGEKSKI